MKKIQKIEINTKKLKSQIDNQSSLEVENEKSWRAKVEDEEELISICGDIVTPDGKNSMKMDTRDSSFENLIAQKNNELLQESQKVKNTEC